MDRNEFTKMMQEQLPDFIPEEFRDGLELIETTVVKMNDQELHGLSFRRNGEEAAPTFYLDEAYERYNNGAPAAVLMRELADTYVKNIDTPGPGKLDLSFDAVKDDLTVRLVEIRRNREFLANVPYMTVGNGLALICDIRMHGEDGHWRATVTREMMEQNGYNKVRLFDHAMQDCGRLDPPVLGSMTSTLFGMTAENLLERSEPIDPEDKEPMFVLTNQEGTLGAATLFYPGVQVQIASVLDEGYTVLPSSVHEVLIVPDSAGIGRDQMREMVREANRTVVQAKDVLSDNIYHYDPEEKTLAVVMDRERASMVAEPGRC